MPSLFPYKSRNHRVPYCEQGLAIFILVPWSLYLHVSAVIAYRFSLDKVLSQCSHASGRVIYSYNKMSLSIDSSNCCAGHKNAQKGHGRIPFGERNIPYVRQVVAAPYFKQFVTSSQKAQCSTITIIPSFTVGNWHTQKQQNSCGNFSYIGLLVLVMNITEILFT